MERQPPAPQGSTEPAAAAAGVVAAEARESAAPAAVAAEGAAAKRRHPPKVDWWISPTSSAPDRDDNPVKPISIGSSRVVLDVVVFLD
jgi:hypothetical protein